MILADWKYYTVICGGHCPTCEAKCGLLGRNKFRNFTRSIFCHPWKLKIFILYKMKNIFPQFTFGTGYSKKITMLHEQSNILFHVGWKQTWRSGFGSNLSTEHPLNSENKKKLMVTPAVCMVHCNWLTKRLRWTDIMTKCIQGISVRLCICIFAQQSQNSINVGLWGLLILWKNLRPI